MEIGEQCVGMDGHKNMLVKSVVGRDSLRRVCQLTNCSITV